MGAAFFFGFVAFVVFVLFCILLLILASTTLIFIWQVKYRRGRNPKNGLLMASTILLAINVAVMLTPVVLVGFSLVSSSF